MVSATRALEIRDCIWAHQGWKDPYTPEERREILAVWDRCPGSYTFYDAVHRVEQEARDREMSNLLHGDGV